MIGPLLAERLSLPFIDRAIPAAVASELAISFEEALAHDDRSSYGVARVLAMMSQAATLYGVQRLDSSDTEVAAELLKLTTELVLWRLAATTGGVVLGPDFGDFRVIPGRWQRGEKVFPLPVR